MRAFYAVKAVLALEEKDFKRHKDAVAYFNQNYVAIGLFDREIGKKLGRLKRKREASDYDDFMWRPMMKQLNSIMHQSLLSMLYSFFLNGKQITGGRCTMKNYSEDASRLYHIQVAKGEVGRYVILPGDPKRLREDRAVL